MSILKKKLKIRRRIFWPGEEAGETVEDIPLLDVLGESSGSSPTTELQEEPADVAAKCTSMMDHHHTCSCSPSPFKPINGSVEAISSSGGLPETPKTHRDLVKNYSRDPSPVQSSTALADEPREPGSAVVCSRLSDLSDWADLFQDVEKEGEETTGEEPPRRWEPETAKMENTLSQTTGDQIINMLLSQEKTRSSCRGISIMDEGPKSGVVIEECGESSKKEEKLRDSDSPGKVGSLKQKKISDMFLKQLEKCHKNVQNGSSQMRKRTKERDSGSSESPELYSKRCKPNAPTYTSESSKSLTKFKEHASNSKGHSHLDPETSNETANIHVGKLKCKNILRSVEVLSKPNELCGHDDHCTVPKPPMKQTEELDAENSIVEKQEQGGDSCDVGITNFPARMKKLKIILKDLRQQSAAGVVLVRYEKDMTLHICETCDKILNSLSKLQQHTRIHTGEKPFKCRYCESRFFNQISQLQRHERLHTKERPFTCKCGRAFNTKYHMKRHARSHEREVYECNLCDRTFRQESALDTHIRVHHYNVKKHQCTECDMKFKYPCQLKTHFRGMHTDEKPYSCDQCDRKFAYSSAVSSHKRVHHSDVKRYKCKECGHSFKQLGTLKNHVRTHTGDRPFCCRYCARSFTQQGNVTLHEKICKELNSTDPV